MNWGNMVPVDTPGDGDNYLLQEAPSPQWTYEIFDWLNEAAQYLPGLNCELTALVLQFCHCSMTLQILVKHITIGKKVPQLEKMAPFITHKLVGPTEFGQVLVI